MLPAERINNIIERLTLREFVSVSALSQELNVSEETIRRDLEKISSSDPSIVRIHGGAYKTGDFDKEVPVPLRETLSVTQKRQIAKLCLPHVTSNETILMDCSTTALYIARLIKQEKISLTIITNSLRIIEELEDCDHIRLICIGGTFRKNTQSFIGYMATSALHSFHADKCFVSCSGIHMQHGLTDNHEGESQVRLAMVNHSDQSFLVVDEKKFGRSFTNRSLSLSNMDAVVTEASLTPDWQNHISASGAILICPAKTPVNS